MKKILPLNYNPFIKSECWTFFRVSIIQAYPNVLNWFTEHFDNLTMNNEYECDFGEFGKRYNVMKYYDSILQTNEHTISDLDEDKLIKFIINNIDNNKYIIIEIDSQKVYKNFEDSYIAEFLIYGYDDEKNVFYTPSIYTGSWREEEINIDDFKEGYRVVKNSDKNELFNRVRGRENKFYLLTLSLKNDYSKNLSLSNFYEELKYLSWDSSRHFECIDDDSLDRLAQYYNGIVGVYNCFILMFSDIVNNKYNMQDATHTHELPNLINRLIEYNVMFLWKVNLYNDTFNLNIDNKINNDIKKIIKNIKISLNIAIKYDFNNEVKYIIKINDYILDCINLTKCILASLIQTLNNYFLN